MASSFDQPAYTYDRDFTDTQIGRWLRNRVHERLCAHFSPGDILLELGCGTGEDAVRLAQQGINVYATDSSRAMRQMADVKKIQSADLRGDVYFLHLDLKRLPRDRFDFSFHGVFSNFGPLNVLDDWAPLAQWLASRVRVGGVVAFGVMSPACAWEPLWHGLHGDFETATRRWRATSTYRTASGEVRIAYPSVRRLERDFAGYFCRTHLEGLGLFLPPSDVYGAIEKRPKLLNTLIVLEKRFGRVPWMAPFADHYWIEFTRTETPC